eukprot:363543-Chlamydomonas_euryale.AAC.5
MKDGRQGVAHPQPLRRRDRRKGANSGVMDFTHRGVSASPKRALEARRHARQDDAHMSLKALGATVHHRLDGRHVGRAGLVKLCAAAGGGGSRSAGIGSAGGGAGGAVGAAAGGAGTGDGGAVAVAVQPHVTLILRKRSSYNRHADPTPAFYGLNNAAGGLLRPGNQTVHMREGACLNPAHQQAHWGA